MQILGEIVVRLDVLSAWLYVRTYFLQSWSEILLFDLHLIIGNKLFN